MARFNSNANRILQAVLSDEHLQKYGEYNLFEAEDMDSALASDNLVVRTVAQIIEGVNSNQTQKEIYNIVTNYLKNNI